jgi:hypothetical protein
MMRLDRRGPEVFMMDLPGMNPVQNVHTAELTRIAGGEKLIRKHLHLNVQALLGNNCLLPSAIFLYFLSAYFISM